MKQYPSTALCYQANDATLSTWLPQGDAGGRMGSEMKGPAPTWEIGTLGDVLTEVVKAAQEHGPQALTDRQTEVAVVVSAEDWVTIRTLLKARLAGGVASKDDVVIGTVRVLLGNRDDVEG